MSSPATHVSRLEDALEDFDAGVRARALAELWAMAERGEIVLPPASGMVNMHCHTFFSFNAYGHSPTSLAWLARRRGFQAAGIVDFDVLDGVDEFLAACELIGLRGSAGIETRVFVPEYASQEINSPGEPGIAYHMGIGFSTGRVAPAAAETLAGLGRQAGERNRAIVERLNAFLDPVVTDYTRDVVPLTPAGHPTERHIVVALIRAAERACADPALFWADKLGASRDDIAAAMSDSPRFQNLLRGRLIKQGGPGYVQPESGMFPTIAALHEMIITCGAVPCAAWLDGTTAAERDPRSWLEFMLGQGILALNIIPDRNWNVPDGQARSVKVRNLYQVVEAARKLDLPLNVGTEMNSFGQKLVDDFDVPELRPVRGAFLEGAYLVYGHTAMQRALGLGYVSDWARAWLPGRRERNEFYTRLGSLLPPGRAALARLAQVGTDPAPTNVLLYVERIVSHG